jgi:hypothetical protein
MPYTPEQCKAFGAKSARGEKVPADWKEHCTKEAQQKAAGHKGLKYPNSDQKHGG